MTTVVVKDAFASVEAGAVGSVLKAATTEKVKEVITKETEQIIGNGDNSQSTEKKPLEKTSSKSAEEAPRASAEEAPRASAEEAPRAPPAGGCPSMGSIFSPAINNIFDLYLDEMIRKVFNNVMELMRRILIDKFLMKYVMGKVKSVSKQIGTEINGKADINGKKNIGEESIFIQSLVNKIKVKLKEIAVDELNKKNTATKSKGGKKLSESKKY